MPTNNEVRQKLEHRQDIEKLNELLRQKQRLQDRLSEIWKEATELQDRINKVQNEYDKRIIAIEPTFKKDKTQPKQKTSLPKATSDKLLDKIKKSPEFEDLIRKELGVY